MASNDSRPLLVIAGPTAVGKSALALALSARIPIEILSADARQVYRQLDIGTAKPTPEEQQFVKHHCIDIRDPHESYSASEYSTDARQALGFMFQALSLKPNASSLKPNASSLKPKAYLPVMVGGSGLYISAAIDGLSVEPADPDPIVREQLQQRLQTVGRDAMYEELLQRDSAAAERYADKNPRRVLRALEYIELTGKTFSSSWDIQRNAANVDALYLVVNTDRDVLNNRIDKRCEEMWQSGIVDETQQVLTSGVPNNAQSLRTVGYREVIDHLNGVLTKDQALEKMKVSTKQYAKRQRTWFRRDERYIWLNDPTVDDVMMHLRNHSSFSQFVDL